MDGGKACITEGPLVVHLNNIFKSCVFEIA